MAIPRRTALRVLAITALTCSVPMSGLAQQSGFAGGSGGGGPLSPTVVATWEAHFEAPAGPAVTDPFAVPLMLDLLVLWRGNPGWLDDASLSLSAGGSDGLHQIASREHSSRLRFDRQAGTIHIRDVVIALEGANVLFLDNVDDANGAVVAGTFRVDPLISDGRAARGGPSVDPLSEMIRRSPALFDYLRCDPLFSDPNDPATPIKLRNCEELR